MLQTAQSVTALTEVLSPEVVLESVEVERTNHFLVISRGHYSLTGLGRPWCLFAELKWAGMAREAIVRKVATRTLT